MNKIDGFIINVNRMRHTKFVRTWNMQPVKHCFSYSPKEGAKAVGSYLAVEKCEFVELFAELRKLIMPNEKVNLFDICRTIINDVNDEDRKILTFIVDNLPMDKCPGFCTYNIAGKVITPKRLRNLFFNAVLFHTDCEHKTEDYLHLCKEPMVFKFALVDFLSYCTNIINASCEVCRIMHRNGIRKNCLSDDDCWAQL